MTIPAAPLAPEGAGVNLAVQAPPVPARWWRDLGDPQLARLVDQALEAAPSLRVARTRIERAAALVDEARAAFEPNPSASVDMVRQRYSANGAIPSALAGKTRNLGTIQIVPNWEFDFFGRNQSVLDAALGQQRLAQTEALAAAAWLATQVVQHYIQLARLVEQHELLGESLRLREVLAELSRARHQAGLEDARQSRQAQAAVIEVRQQLTLLDEGMGVQRRALAALSAQPPVALEKLTPRLSFASRLPVPEDVPADLVGRRADLVAARWRVEIATRDIAAAQAQFYPNVNLTALIGATSIGLDRLLRVGSLQAGVGPAIRLPIFDAPRLRAQLRGRESDLDLAIESYNQTLIDAVRDVADRLGILRSLARQQAEQRLAAQEARALREIAEQRQRAGVGTRLAVISAQGGELMQRQQQIDLQARLIDTQVTLIRALGGGYGDELVAPPASRISEIASGGTQDSKRP